MTSASPSSSFLVVLSLPAADRPAEVRLTLRPGDVLPAGNGRAKPLADCTLAELSAFAEALEAELLGRYGAQTLAELLAQAGWEARLVGHEEREGQTPTESDWLQAEVWLPAAEQGGAAEPAAEAAGDGPAEPAEAAQPGVEGSTEPAAVGGETGVREPAARLPWTQERPRHRILGRRRPLNHPTWTAVDILCHEGAFRDAQAHALTSLDREVAGMLLGPPPEKQPDGRYLVQVSASMIAKHTRMHGASVTYTPESWRYVHDRMATLYPDDAMRIVGWYHTHPGFGIFLSGMDQFIHHNFFTQLWHIALVMDPLAAKSGFFCWDREQKGVAGYDFPWPGWAAGSW
ncbi:MAG: hypothetical protein ACRDHL_00750 [Candidatus Promineifilaceae bacterium]